MPGDTDDEGSGGGRAHAPFFLPTGEPDNTAAPSVEIDARGRIHAVYPAFAGGDAYYATCAGDCASPEAFELVRLPTDQTVANVMLALDAEGRPRVLMSTFEKVVYATCEEDCGSQGAWAISTILDHHGDREVSGQAFALDPEGRPRFLMHTYVAFLGVGQKAPETAWVTCDASCHDPSSWKQQTVSDQIWQSSALRIDGAGRVRVGTVAHVVGEDRATHLVGAYVQCDGACGDPASWRGVALESAFHTDYDALPFPPAISLALTAADAPRLALIGQDEASQRRVVYLACDADCTDGARWNGTILADQREIGPGIDLAVDAAGDPRIAYTLDYNIGLLHCDGDCTDEGAAWDVTPVELSGEMDPDTIFLEENCHVAAWFLHAPSVALAADGAPRVGYQARDISGGWDDPDPTQPACVAGTDMTWSRFAQLDPVR